MLVVQRLYICERISRCSSRCFDNFVSETHIIHVKKIHVHRCKLKVQMSRCSVFQVMDFCNKLTIIYLHELDVFDYAVYALKGPFLMLGY